jgi:hypothetical protein
LRRDIRAGEEGQLKQKALDSAHHRLAMGGESSAVTNSPVNFDCGSEERDCQQRHSRLRRHLLWSKLWKKALRQSLVKGLGGGAAWGMKKRRIRSHLSASGWKSSATAALVTARNVLRQRLES